MKKLSLLLLVILTVFTSCKENTNTEKEVISTYYLIRHAEKDRSDSTNKNPHLTEKGLQRAENWAQHFKTIKFDMVYTTNYNRTIQTAKPTAKANKTELQFYNPSDLNIEEFLVQTKGKTSLIVGHSNTIPKFANALLGEEKYNDIADTNNANLYKITFTEDGKTAELLVVD